MLWMEGEITSGLEFIVTIKRGARSEPRTRVEADHYQGEADRNLLKGGFTATAANAGAHAGVQNELKMINGNCNKVLFQVADGVNGNTGQAENIVFIASLFTPIHTAGKGVESITFGVSVWGRPPEIGANSLPR